MKIINVVGARPNFMKMAPLVDAMKRYPDKIEQCLVHTGQHYDDRMSRTFFEDLGMPRPDIDLEVGSGSHARQTARIMMAFEPVCREYKPDLVIVVGDVNSTLACALTAKKLNIAVAHVEAGLRSHDMTMPEEINRLCTDAVCDYLFTTDKIAGENLQKEGIVPEKIHFVGNVMIDTLLKHRDKAKSLNLVYDLGLIPGEYTTLTLHRPGNVDDREILTGILQALAEIAHELPIIFPAHPRTRKMIEQFGLQLFFNSGNQGQGIHLLEPLSYLEFLHLNMQARMVITDSGGLQEETTVSGIPCLTLRPNTERPITCLQGTNQLVGNRPEAILKAARQVLDADKTRAGIPALWDGHAVERIVEVLLHQNWAGLTRPMTAQ